jgi:ABC-type thiamine transport system substrate-binding protein
MIKNSVIIIIVLVLAACSSNNAVGTSSSPNASKSITNEVTNKAESDNKTKVDKSQPAGVVENLNMNQLQSIPEPQAAQGNDQILVPLPTENEQMLNVEEPKEEPKKKKKG